MLNIENKYKAFHISIYPHTSPTAGLNIFFVFFLRKHFIQGGRKDAYTHLHMQMNMSTPAIKPEVQTTIPSMSIHKKEEEKMLLLKFINLCRVLCLSRQLLKMYVDHSFKNGISHTPQSNATSLITNKRTTWNPSFATDEWLLVLTKKKGILNIFPNWGSNDKQKVIALLSSISNEVSLREDDPCLNVEVRQQMLRHSYNMITLLLTLHTATTATLLVVSLA